MDAKWIVIRRWLRGHNMVMICLAGGQPPVRLSAAWGLVAFRVYFVFLVDY
jgi:hypothetical protein